MTSDHFIHSGTAARDHALFRALLRTTKDGVLVLDGDGTVLVYNDAAENIFQHAPDAVLGNNAAMLVVPASRETLSAQLSRAPSVKSPLALEMQGQRKDQSHFPMLLSLGIGELDNRRVFLAVVQDQTVLHRERLAYDEEKAYAALIIDSVNDAIIAYMLDGTVRSWNRAAERMFGYKASEIVGSNARALIAIFIPPAVAEKERAILNRVLAGESVAPYETVRLHRDGSLVPILISATPIRDAYGQVVGIARTARDLREQQTRQQERALLDLAINSSDDTFTCIGLDDTVLTWNSGAERMLGYTAREMVGQKASWVIGKIVPADMIALEKDYSRRAAAGERIGPYRTTRIRKDGTVLTAMSVVAPVRNEDGKVLAISRTLQDLTERMAFEQQRALLISIVESSNDAVFSKTLDGIITSWNGGAEAMFGFKAEEIIGQPGALVIPPDFLDEERRTLETIRNGGTLRHFETLRRRKNGSVFDVSISVSPLRDVNGVITGASATVRDITEKKMYEQRLQEMREDMIHVARVQELSQVSAGIAHELNQPLAAMLNYSNAAKRLAATDDPSAIRKLPAIAEKIGDQAERAAKIIRRMRDFVEKRDPQRSEIDLNIIVDDALALALIGNKSSNIETEVKRSPGAAYVEADVVQIQQVLVNLLRNAADAMADTERRELTVAISHRTDAFVEVSVSDTGAGIPRHIASRLFAPFVTTKPEGMGIGLAISRSIIEAHGGEMSAEPNPGGGTIFRFTLPACAQRADDAS